MVPIDSPCMVSLRVPLTPSSYLSPFSKYLMCSISDLELGQFKVIQCVMVPTDSPWVVSYSTSIDTIIVSVTVFEISDTKF